MRLASHLQETHADVIAVELGGRNLLSTRHVGMTLVGDSS